MESAEQKAARLTNEFLAKLESEFDPIYSPDEFVGVMEDVADGVIARMELAREKVGR